MKNVTLIAILPECSRSLGETGSCLEGHVIAVRILRSLSESEALELRLAFVAFTSQVSLIVKTS